MKIKGVLQEDFVNYKKPAMFISMPNCTFKCERESGVQCCQNSALAAGETIEINTEALVSKYLSNPITKAVVFGGLEPMDSFEEVADFIRILRSYGCRDDVVIYTGYNKEEIGGKVFALSAFPSIVIKYGRFIPGSEQRYDEVLGVALASKNQYAERIS